MDRLRIKGGRELEGDITISSSKNAILPCMAAALLGDGRLTLEKVPSFKDVDTMCLILRELGMEVAREDALVTIKPSDLSRCVAPYDLVRTMRASFFVLGPLLGKRRRARVSLPGGCAIGARPINYHLDGLAAMGARIDIRDGYVEANAERLRGARIALEMASVGATENLMMAATLAEGTTVITNAAREPEVVDLAALLGRMGARISGAGTQTLMVEGVKSLGGARHIPIPDRIEAGTFLLLSIMTGCRIRVVGARRDHLAALEESLLRAGAVLEDAGGSLRVACPVKTASADVTTFPYPGFPTDMQAQWTTLMSTGNGSCTIRETVFENRFQHVPELARMGADISVKGGIATVRGVKGLRGAPVMVSDLRAGAALVMAGLAAEGETMVNRIYHLDRGYENLAQKLVSVGACIERIPGARA